MIKMSVRSAKMVMVLISNEFVNNVLHLVNAHHQTFLIVIVASKPQTSSLSPLMEYVTKIVFLKSVTFAKVIIFHVKAVI